jgi:glutaredoxin
MIIKALKQLKILNMNSKSQKIILVVAAIAIGALIIWGLNQPSNVAAPAGEIIYYYSSNCPHCTVVSRFLDENKVAEKVNYVKKEVSGSRENQQEFLAAAAKCGNNSDKAVPFLYTPEKCYLGQDGVIKFFKEKAGIAG